VKPGKTFRSRRESRKAKESRRKAAKRQKQIDVDFHGEKRRLQEAFALALLLLLLLVLGGHFKRVSKIGIALSTGESLIRIQLILTTSIESCTKFCKSSFLAV
jgi:hypothetical protein